jgi:hypothetical protein
MDIALGDRVRIDIPDETDPDFAYHGIHGIVIDIKYTPYPCEDIETVRVALDEPAMTIDLQPWDVRPPLHDELCDTRELERR